MANRERFAAFARQTLSWQLTLIVETTAVYARFPAPYRPPCYPHYGQLYQRRAGAMPEAPARRAWGWARANEGPGPGKGHHRHPATPSARLRPGREEAAGSFANAPGRPVRRMKRLAGHGYGPPGPVSRPMSRKTGLPAAARQAGRAAAGAHRDPDSAAHGVTRRPRTVTGFSRVIMSMASAGCSS